MFSPRLLFGVAAIGFVGTVGITCVPGFAEDHAAPSFAKLTFSNGTTRTLKFKGVGCAVSVCSRVVIKSTVKPESLSQASTWLDSLAAIKDPTPRDALFVFKDGTQKRLAVVPGNRFLYLADGKVELSNLRAVEFLAR
jgi:hypothetical protein